MVCVGILHRVVYQCPFKKASGASIVKILEMFEEFCAFFMNFYSKCMYT